MYYGNSTAYYVSDGWECPHCDYIFWIASAWSINDGAVGGVLCPACGEFIADDELEVEAD